MKNYLIIAILAMGINLAACQSGTKKTAKSEEETCQSACSQCPSKSCASKIAENTQSAGIYYFHGDRKCKTCKAVGAKAKELAEQLKVNFYDVNIDQEENKSLAEEFQATGSSLMVKHAKSGKIEDLTNFAFRNAINNPEAYLEKLKTTIKSEG